MDKVTVIPEKTNAEPMENVAKINVGEQPRKSSTPLVIAGIVVVIIIGIAVGYVLSNSSSVGGLTLSTVTGGKIIKSDKIVGSMDEKAYPDKAEGKLEKGGIDGEGTHKLIRDGGPSQTAYLTSSTIDLDQFVGKKVRVWGESRAAQKAGWLMDVGRLEILE